MNHRENNLHEPNHFDTSGFLFFVRYLFIFSVLYFGASTLSSVGFETYYMRGVKATVLQSQKQVEKLEVTLQARKNELKKLEFIQKNTLQTRTIHAKTIESEIPVTGKFIATDLDQMKLHLYEDGTKLKEYSIVSKGRPGSEWETPSGAYTILLKSRNHFSSIGEVYMPYSMQFYGNFFIHGWPYYEGGTPVPEGFSGGCIRLTTEDAKEIFEFAEKGTSLFVYEDRNQENSSLSHAYLKNISAPEVSAASYIVADIETGEVFLEKESSAILPIASVTKLMTAVVANEAIGVNRILTVTRDAVNTHGDTGNLKQGEAYTVRELLYPLLMESSNDAARVLSTFYAEGHFIELMNKKAEALGMQDTTFTDSSGLSPGNHSSVHDLFFLAEYIAHKKPFVLGISRTPIKKHETNLTAHEWQNFNIFSADPKFVGGKTGHTDAAKDTMLTVFKRPIGDTDHVITIIVLGSDDREKDVRALLDWFEEITS